MTEERSPLLNAESTGTQSYLDVEVEKNKNDVPTMEDPGWSDYILSLLTDDEKYDNNPTTDGLRRVVNLVLGPIVESVPIVIQAPTPQNDNHGTVAWKLAIRWDDNPLDIRVFGDVADVYIGNTDKQYAIYSTATAATRAEGRSLRKALQLKHVVAAEELTEVAPEDPTKITKGQIAYINNMCSRNDINVIKLLSGSKTFKFTTVEDVPYHAAVQITKYLNDCQNGQQSLPENYKGYDPDWRK